jgi:inositol-phosphate phosphatase/L-galactose 1-phosphate phosphatase/histidinol-phosphatase
MTAEPAASHPCPPELVALAERMADAVADVHRAHFRRTVAIEWKEDGSPVTEVDKLAERTVRELVTATFPDHGVIGEEFPPLRPDADYVWVVDPLDGTKLYLSGKPQFALLLALAHRGRFILGLIDQPILGERWVGANGRGTTLNGRPVRTRDCVQLAEAVICRPGVGDNTLDADEAIDRVSRSGRWVHWGVTPYDCGLLASGFIDLIVTAGPKLHDLAPLDPLIRNAGGAVSDWKGARLDLGSRDYLVAAATKDLLDQALPLLHR